jgi:glutamyl-tRNA synthetase
MVEAGHFYFRAPAAWEPEAVRKLFTPDGIARLRLLADRLGALAPFDAEHVESLVRQLAAERGLKLVDLAQLARLAVTGRTISPPIFQVMALLGRDETLARIEAALQAAPRPAG